MTAQPITLERPMQKIVILLLPLLIISLMPLNGALAQAEKPADVKEAQAKETSTRVYDVRDLILIIQDYPYTGTLGVPADRGSVGTPESDSAATTRPTRTRQQ